MSIRTILVPIDFSAGAAKALDTAAGLAQQFEARLVLIHAHHIDVPVASHFVAGGPILPVGYEEQAHQRASEAVESMVRQASDWGIDVTGRAVMGHASQSILEEAEQLPADLIVMGTRGNSGLKHVLLGSVAERVIRMAPCPVLTVKAD